jgi:hypothetical protein
MSRQTLKDAQFRIIGYIDTADDGRQTARDAQFRIVGYYEPNTNQTKDAQFRVVAHGNLLASLLR